jgi:hypothetical protein
MGVVERDWFEPRRLFDEGYPDGLTSALRVLPQVRQAVRDEVASFAARSLLEIGPGDAPVADRLAGVSVTYLDAAARFLAPLAGLRVVGDLFAAPFEPGTFDLVVAGDVLTHVRPARRREALARMAELGRHMLVFNPEPGTGQVQASSVPSPLITIFFEERGYQVASRRFVATTPGGDYPMKVIKARR